MSIGVTTELAGLIAQSFDTNAFSQPANSKLIILSGTQPTSTDLQSIADGTTATAAWGADILAVFSIDANVVNNTMTIPSATPPADITTSGTATWFALVENEQDVGNNNFSVLTGSITAPTFGGDMEISNTNLVAGQRVYIADVKFTFT